jgi:hypothetical protein
MRRSDEVPDHVRPMAVTLRRVSSITFYLDETFGVVGAFEYVEASRAFLAAPGGRSNVQWPLI